MKIFFGALNVILFYDAQRFGIIIVKHLMALETNFFCIKEINQKSENKNEFKYLVMFENLDELIEVNVNLLYLSKSQYMMRINFKDEFGFNLKNSKSFADILVEKGIVILESNQGFRCDLTELGRQIYEKGGWIKYLNTIEPYAKYKADIAINSEVKKIEKSFLKKIMFAGLIILALSFFLTIVTLEIYHK